MTSITTPGMEPAAYLACLRSDARAITAAARAVDLDVPVAACPGWAMRDLVAHVAQVHRWVATIVWTRCTEAVNPRSLASIPPDDDVVDIYERGATELVTLLEDLEPNTPLWNWAEPGDADFWFRRMAHETAVHRWDAEHAAGVATPITPTALALDGIDELLDVLLTLRLKIEPGPAATMHLHATDPGRADGTGEWLVTIADAVTTTRGHDKGDVALRGNASDLLLWAWGRMAATDPALEVYGDAAILTRWSETVKM